MGKAARAIIIENGRLLVMHRNKEGSQYYTLVGGRIAEDESIEQGLVREIKEETDLDITNCRLVFTEKHAAPYNDQYIFLCEVAPHDSIALQDTSEEAFLNKMGSNTHAPAWANTKAFAGMPFRTPQLQAAIVIGLKKGFPKQTVQL